MVGFCGNRKVPRYFYVLLTLSLIFTCLGIGFLAGFDSLIRSQVASSIPLSENSTNWNNWLSPPVPIYMQFWFYNITNPAEILLGEKPVVQHHGPYTYQEHRIKQQVQFNGSNLLGYIEQQSFNFVPNMSVGSESDIFFTINLGLVAMGNQLKYNPLAPWAGLIFNYFDKFYRSYTVSQLLWGYEDPGLTAINSVLSVLKKSINTTVGIFTGRNNSNDGHYYIYDGQDDLSKFGTVYTWKGMHKLPYWTSDEANMINGTDGTMFHPFVSNDDVMYIFSSDLCRSIYGTYTEDMTLKGISVKRFRVPAIVFEDEKQNPDNAGFCVPNCLGSGVLNVSVCQPTAPIIMSQPHFYEADNRYLTDIVDIISPELADEMEWSTYLDVEPWSGVVLSAGKKLQINIVVQPIPGVPQSANVKEVFLPLMWLNESVLVDDHTASQVRAMITTPIQALAAIKYTVFAVGIFMLVCCLIWLANMPKKTPGERSPLIVNNSENTTRTRPNETYSQDIINEAESAHNSNHVNLTYESDDNVN